MSATDTADRLALPSPCCDLRGTTAAYVYGELVALHCTSCGHVWTERASVYAVLRRACELDIRIVTGAQVAS